MSSKPTISKSASKAAKAAKAAGRPLGRIASIKAAANQRTVDDIMNDEDLENIVFARVTRHLGDSRIRVACADMREHLARIPQSLANKRATCIAVDDVIALERRSYESRSERGAKVSGIAEEEVFTVFCVLPRRNAAKLVKQGRIPCWMITSEATEDIKRKATGGAGAPADDTGFEWDYEAAALEEALGDEADINVDEI
jgi:translation initiation factor IF-1